MTCQSQCPCGNFYIEQSGRSIQSRVQEHRKDAELNQVERSAVAQHFKENDLYKVKYDEIKTLVKSIIYIILTS